MPERKLSMYFNPKAYTFTLQIPQMSNKPLKTTTGGGATFKDSSTKNILLPRSN